MEKKSLLDNFLEIIVITLLIIIIVAVNLQVVFFFFFHNPLYWSEELSKLSFVWMIFIGSALATRDKIHIQMDYFADKLSPKVQCWLFYILQIMCIAFLMVVIIFSVPLMGIQGNIKSVGLNLSMNYFTFAVFIGSIFILIYILKDIFSKLKRDSN